MLRLESRRPARWAIVAAVALVGGCSSTPSKPKEHASSSLLSSEGKAPRLSRKQQADLKFAIGRELEASGNYDGARPAYLAALKQDPKRADAEVRLAILDDRKGNAPGADAHFARALALQPRNPEILCDQGYSLYLRRRWADAETSLKKALILDSSHARSHSNLALVLARKGDTPGALAEFARAGCDPSDARSNLGLVLALEGRFEESRREYALALAAKPTSARAEEGLKATVVALSGRVDARSIAANGQAAPPVDPALIRTSAPGPGSPQ